MIPFVDLKAQYESIKTDIDLAIKDILDKTAFIMGKPVESFEKNFADFCNAKYAIGTSCGTSALHVAILASGVKPGQEIITVPNTFIATTEAISKAGAKIRFVDIDPETYTIDTSKVEDAINDNTAAILPVDIYGQPAELQPLLEIAEKYNLKVIEDAAQAHGATYKTKKIGSISHSTCFSFYPGKNLGAYGDGGIILTNDETLYNNAFMIRDHGRKKGDKYVHTIEGFNFRLDALQAAILNAKLKYLEKWIDMRIKYADLYSGNLANFVVTPKVGINCKSVFHLYVIRCNDRDNLASFLKGKGISVGIHYPIPLHLQPAYRHLGHKTGDFPITEKYSKEILSLPLYPELGEERVRFVIESIKEFYGGKNV